MSSSTSSSPSSSSSSSSTSSSSCPHPPPPSFLPPLPPLNFYQLYRLRSILSPSYLSPIFHSGPSLSLFSLSSPHPSHVSHLHLSRSLHSHRGCVNRIEFSSDFSLLASGSDDCKVKIWSTTTLKLLTTLRTGHGNNIFGVSFIDNNQSIVSCGMDSEVRMMKIENNRDVLHVWKCHQSRVKDIAVSHQYNDKIFWTAGEDGTLREFDIRTPHVCLSNPSSFSSSSECSNVLVNFSSSLPLKGISISPTNSHLIALACDDPIIRIVDRRYIKFKNLGSLTDISTVHKHRDCWQLLTASHLQSSHHATFVSFDDSGKEVIASFHGEHCYSFDVGRGGEEEGEGGKKYKMRYYVGKREEEEEEEEGVESGQYMGESKEEEMDNNVNLSLSPLPSMSIDMVDDIPTHIYIPLPITNFIPSEGTSPIYSVSSLQSSSMALTSSSSSSSSSLSLSSSSSPLLPPPLPPHIIRLKERGNSHFTMGHYSSAIATYTEAILHYHGKEENIPSLSILYSNRAAALLKRKYEGDVPVALMDCQRALHLDGKNSKAFYRRILCYKTMGKMQKARRLARRAVKIFNGQSEFVDILQEIEKSFKNNKNPNEQKNDKKSNNNNNKSKSSNPSEENENESERESGNSNKHAVNTSGKKKGGVGSRGKPKSSSSSSTDLRTKRREEKQQKKRKSEERSARRKRKEMSTEKEKEKDKERKTEKSFSSHSNLHGNDGESDRERESEGKAENTPSDKEQTKSLTPSSSSTSIHHTSTSSPKSLFPSVSRKRPPVLHPSSSPSKSSPLNDSETSHMDTEATSDEPSKDKESEGKTSVKENNDQEEKAKQSSSSASLSSASSLFRHSRRSFSRRVNVKEESISHQEVSSSAEEEEEEEKESEKKEKGKGKGKETKKEKTNNHSENESESETDTDEDEDDEEEEEEEEEDEEDDDEEEDEEEDDDVDVSLSKEKKEDHEDQGEDDDDDKDEEEQMEMEMEVENNAERRGKKEHKSFHGPHSHSHSRHRPQFASSSSSSNLQSPYHRRYSPSYLPSRSSPSSLSSLPLPSHRKVKMFRQRYVGNANVQTDIKESTYWGNYILSGSDCGRIFIWERKTGRLVKTLWGSKEVVNCVRGHPYVPMIFSSGIDNHINVWKTEVKDVEGEQEEEKGIHHHERDGEDNTVYQNMKKEVEDRVQQKKREQSKLSAQCKIPSVSEYEEKEVKLSPPTDMDQDEAIADRSAKSNQNSLGHTDIFPSFHIDSSMLQLFLARVGLQHGRRRNMREDEEEGEGEEEEEEGEEE